MNRMSKKSEKDTKVCDYLSAKLVLTGSTVPEDQELTVCLPFDDGGLVSLAISDVSDPDSGAEIQLNRKQARALFDFLLLYERMASENAHGH